ncbi:MAG: ferrous iron transporter B, partial [Spirochaetaceae bacterium]|nr:ferrous iron transporter B [Spirochaetaceae bacterium]
MSESDEVVGQNQTTSSKVSDVLLIGQPNVGKSVLFSHLSGVRTIASNYPGTTVSYTKGKIRLEGREYLLVDAPGTYSLEPLDEAARVTIGLIDGARRIINVLDSSRLERHLPLTLELLAQHRSMVVALNMSDEARVQGVTIDIDMLSERLGVPVVAITARSGEGVRDLIDAVLALPPSDVGPSDGHPKPAQHPHIPARHHSDSATGHAHMDRAEVWRKVGAITGEVQTLRHHHPTFGQWLEMISVHPVWGSLVALLVIAGTFSLVRLLGEFLIGGAIGIVGEPWLTLPFGTELLFDTLLKPPLMALSRALDSEGFLHALLIGHLVEGDIDFMQSFGLLTSGLFIPLGAVLPYIVSFYFALALLEDSGYLPRLAVFLDTLMHRLGLHGYAIIPTLLGLGCNVPGILSTRILETRRQRFITATLISIAVPCAALQAMIVGLVGDRGVIPVLIVYGFLAITWFVIGVILRFTSKGTLPELLVEIPPYRLPVMSNVLRKLWMRVNGFLREAIPVVLGAVFVVNILFQFEVFDFIAGLTSPVVSFLWGLPEDAVVPLLIGILRKDVAVGMFAPLGLTTAQLVTGTIVLAMFFP